MADYRIDELARAGGTSVRNVRYYQDSRILPPPRREGRVALYSDSHLARLRLITRLLDRGYTAANITELLTAWEQGRDLSDVLGLEQVVSGFWSDEIPSYLTGEQLLALFGPSSGEPELLDRVVNAGLADRDGTRYRLPSPRALHAMAELIRLGAPLSTVLELGGQLLRNIDDVVRGFVDALAEHVLRDRDPDWMPSTSEIPELANLGKQIKPLVTSAISAAFSLSLDRHVEQTMGEYVTRILPRLKQQQAVNP